MNRDIIIADDHPITLKGMESLLVQMGFNIISSFNNGLHALNGILSQEPDYALLDVQMPGMCGIDIAEKLIAAKSKTKIIIYTMYNDYALFGKAKELGVNGYLLKELAVEELKECVKSLERGVNWYSPNLEEMLSSAVLSFIPELYCLLSPAERTIVKSIANQKSSKEIAKEQFISVKTVENHRSNIIKKLELPNKKNSLLMWAIENKGFLPLVN